MLRYISMLEQWQLSFLRKIYKNGFFRSFTMIEKIMRQQQKIWLSEHTNMATLPTMANQEPSGGVVKFVAWLVDNNIQLGGNLIDIGCGKGRNSIYCALQGYQVYGIDYIPQALETAQALADSQQVSEKVQFQIGEMDVAWPYEDNFFDCALDSFASIDIETKEGRTICRDQMLRTLKPGGYALVMVVSSDDEWERVLMHESPGKEPHSSIWPQNGKFQKNYDELELREFYKDFNIVALETISKTAFKLEKYYQATNFWLVLQKPV